MRLAIISFTQRGTRLNAALSKNLSLAGFVCESYGVKKYALGEEIRPLEESPEQWTGRMFSEADALLFIGAAGIAVRSIAPWLTDKTKDPAVVVMDEKGMFAVSLLSGHLGGANELAGTLANLTGAIPVITTATDVNGRFAVDLFAKNNGLFICDMSVAKEISADVLDEKKIGFFSEFPVLGEIPEELEVWEEAQVFEGSRGICVTLDETRHLYKRTLCLIPKVVSVGVGCKKGTEPEVIRRRVKEELARQGISLKSVEYLASIDLKKEEPGIRALARELGAEFVTYSPEELAGAQGAFSSSDFVESVTGVDNVCERSAVMASGNGILRIRKTAAAGVTVAAAVRDWRVDFG